MFIFLICSERSGSNFITNLIGGHPDISAPPPSHLYRIFCNNRSNYGDLKNDENWMALIDDVVDNFRCKLGVWNTDITADELLNNSRVRNVAELLRIIYTKEAGSENASSVFIKENQTYQFADYLLQSYPDTRFIYMVRDPRDVASSWVSTHTMPGGVEKAVDTWLADQENALVLYEAIKSSGKILLVRYEDVLADAESSLKAITKYMGMAYDENMLKFYKNPRTIANAQRIDAWSNLLNPVMKNNAGKYKDTLSDSDQRYVELRCMKAMKKLGYSPDMIDYLLPSDEKEKVIQELLPMINKGAYLIKDSNESDIRKRRLSAINRVLQRKL